MQRAAIDYHGDELEAWEDADLWTVRLGELEASAGYLDLALAELLDDAEGVHTLAARLLAVGAGWAGARAFGEDIAPSRDRLAPLWENPDVWAVEGSDACSTYGP